MYLELCVGGGLEFVPLRNTAPAFRSTEHKRAQTDEEYTKKPSHRSH